MRIILLGALTFIMLQGVIEARNIEILPSLKENPKTKNIQKMFKYFLKKKLKYKKNIHKNTIFSLSKLKKDLLRSDLKHK
jgi:hypothetical protein